MMKRERSIDIEVLREAMKVVEEEIFKRREGSHLSKWEATAKIYKQRTGHSVGAMMLKGEYRKWRRQKGWSDNQPFGSPGEPYDVSEEVSEEGQEDSE